jgi:hypothetical protein
VKLLDNGRWIFTVEHANILGTVQPQIRRSEEPSLGGNRRFTLRVLHPSQFLHLFGCFLFGCGHWFVGIQVNLVSRADWQPVSRCFLGIVTTGFFFFPGRELLAPARAELGRRIADLFLLAPPWSSVVVEGRGSSCTR